MEAEAEAVARFSLSSRCPPGSLSVGRLGMLKGKQTITFVSLTLYTQIYKTNRIFFRSTKSSVRTNLIQIFSLKLGSLYLWSYTRREFSYTHYFPYCT